MMSRSASPGQLQPPSLSTHGRSRFQRAARASALRLARRNDEQARRRSDGRLVGRARGVAALRRGLCRCAGAARLPRQPHRRRPRHRDGADRGQARRRAQCAARPAGRGRHAAGHAGDPRHSRTPIRACMASAVAMQKDVAKDLFRVAGVPVPEGVVASRFEVAKAHLLPPPYVIKPIAEGSSVGVFIVTRGPCPSAAGAHPRGLGLRRAGHRRKLHCRQGVDLRGHGRRGARRDRDRADGTILRL